MDQSRRPFGIILCAVILVLAGCRSGPPPEQVRSFSTAVTEMRNAGNLLYDKLGAALPEAAPATAADRNCANAVRLGVPCRFDPATAGVGSGARADRLLKFRRGR